ncbi:nucleotide-binding alpha-beta plait domain-containing protein [Tanacetum coccineum]
MNFRSTPCVFLGYSPSHHGYHCLDISTECLYIARHVRFNEVQFPFDIPKPTSLPLRKHLPITPRNHLIQPSPVSTTSIPTPPLPTPPPPPPPPPPITRKRPWRQAMKEEYDALMKNGTWSLVPCASNTNVVDGKWVYRLKRDKNGAITRYKARFVAKAFAVNKVCQYIHAPTKIHWSTVKRILRYLHGTVEHGMLIRRSTSSTLQAFTDVLWKGNPDTSLEAFSDADWVGDSDD